MTTAIAKKMPDGTVCRTGPNCRRHGAGTNSLTNQISTELKKAKAAVVEKDKSLPFPEGKVRRGLNETPDWSKELYQESREVEALLEADKCISSVESYRMTSFIEVNKYLRDGKKNLVESQKQTWHNEESIKDMLSSTEKRIADIDRAFTHQKTWDTPKLLYRAVAIEEEGVGARDAYAYAKEKYAVGSILEEKAYASTSADSDYMLFFSRYSKKKRKPHIVYEIAAHKGLPIMESHHRENPHHVRSGDIQSYEREVLLDRGTKFRVVGVKKVAFEHTYQSTRDSWGHDNTCYYVNGCPKRHTYTVVQMEQII